MKLPKNLVGKIEQRKQENSIRKLNAPCSNIDFSSNDYLGLARSKSVYTKASLLLKKNQQEKNGATGSRLISGNSLLFDQVEQQLAKFFDAEKALIYNSGYAANIGILSAVVQRGDVILYDELCHASIRDGLQLSYGQAIKFKHNDLPSLKTKYNTQKRKGIPGNIFIITESIFSMDGDAPDLRALIQFAKKENIYIIIDEAHACGILGKNGQGMIHALGLQKKVFARIVTFGKSFGAHGAAILGTETLREFLINFSRSFIYTTAISPHTLATILITLKELSLKKNRIPLLKNIQYFKTQLGLLSLEKYFISSESAIMSCIIPGNTAVKKIEQVFLSNGIVVKAILSPTVARGQERLRFCLHAYNTKLEIKAALGLLQKAIEDLDIKMIE